MHTKFSSTNLKGRNHLRNFFYFIDSSGRRVSGTNPRICLELNHKKPQTVAGVELWSLENKEKAQPLDREVEVLRSKSSSAFNVNVRVDWIQLALDRVQYRALVNTIMNPGVSWRMGNLFSCSSVTSLWRRNYCINNVRRLSFYKLKRWKTLFCLSRWKFRLVGRNGVNSSCTEDVTCVVHVKINGFSLKWKLKCEII